MRGRIGCVDAAAVLPRANVVRDTRSDPDGIRTSRLHGCPRQPTLRSMGTVVAGVELSRPEKELFPASTAPAATKQDLATYYARVAHAMLPHVRGRAISMQRFPDGIEGPSFYEK